MNGQVGKGGITHSARKEAGDVTVIMRESEGEEAVHACSVTAHDLYKGMRNLYMTSRNFESCEYSTFCFCLCNLYSLFSVYPYHCACAV